MRLIPGVYSYLSSHQATRNDPFFDKRRLWSGTCIRLWRWLFEGQIAAEIQVVHLTVLLQKAEEKRVKTFRLLVAAEKAGELSFYEALQIAGVLVECAGSDAYAKFYDETKRDYSNDFADMSDVEFSALTYLPPRITGARYLNQTS